MTEVTQLTADEQQHLQDLLASWMPAQRWFAGKGHELTEVRLSEVSALPGPVRVHHVIVEVQLDGTTWQTYQVPVVLHDTKVADLAGKLIGAMTDGSSAYDAMAEPQAAACLLALVNTDPRVDPAATHSGQEPGGPILQAVADPATYRDLPARLLNVEQSNTSITFGGAALMKVFRMLTPGINPDVEVHEALGRVGCQHVGRILGWLNGAWADPQTGQVVTGHLAMVQQFLSPSVDGWDLSREKVAAGADFTAESHALGLATGAVHLEMRRALQTHTLSTAEIARLVERLHGRLDRAIAIVPELAPLSAGLHADIERLRTYGKPLEVQRVHGDYHLGQVLLAEDGWKLLDFEGEPGGDIASRTVLDHPLRDVAAMLRSYAYAASLGGAGRDPAEVAQWQHDCERAFLRGYAESGAGDPDAEEAVLAAYEVDKAAYEAVYEKRNRPDWLEVPLSALRALAGGGPTHG